MSMHSRLIRRKRLAFRLGCTQWQRHQRSAIKLPPRRFHWLEIHLCKQEMIWRGNTQRVGAVEATELQKEAET